MVLRKTAIGEANRIVSTVDAVLGAPRNIFLTNVF